MKRFIFLVLVFVLVSDSCQKSNDGNVNIQNDTFTIKSNSISCTNSKNPYEYIGELHNEICEYLINIDDGSPLNLSSTISNIDTYLKTEYDSTINFITFFDDYVSPAFSVQALKSLNTLSAAKTYIASISSIQDNKGVNHYLDLMLNALFSHNSFNLSCYNEMVGIEAGILLDDTLNNDDKQLLLIGGAILRHSSFLWDKYGDEHPAKGLHWSWGNCVTGDLTGAMQAWGFLGVGPWGWVIFGATVACYSTASALL
ncbi:MAG: hypothetical protein LBH92_06720 [Bacteroidales bacterium]|jgi:hypothetical protein|nr:hypothetical protein [Bacteroidales bacterium]